MKKPIFNSLLGLALVCSPILYAQDILWEKSFGGIHADYLMDVQPTADYGFILAGSSLSKKSGNKTQDNKGDLDYWIWKMDEKGELDWQKSFGGSGTDFLQSIALTNDGGFILAGISSSPKSFDKKTNAIGDADFWIIKLDANGNELWQKTIGGQAQEKVQSIRQTADGGYIIGGSSSSDPSSQFPSSGGVPEGWGGNTMASLPLGPNDVKAQEKTAPNHGNMDYWVVKLNSKGAIEWQKSFGGEYNDELRSLAPTKDGGYIIGGYSNSPASGNKTDDTKGIGDYWILKLDKLGEITWQKTIGGMQDDQLSALHQTYDGNYILGGNSNSRISNDKSKGNEEGSDFWIIKIDEKGSILWQETYNVGKIDVLTSLIENKDHTLLLSGYSPLAIEGGTNSGLQMGRKKKTEKGINDYVAIKVNEKGEELWRRSLGSDGEDILKKAIETRDGGYLFAGTTNPQTQTRGTAQFPSSAGRAGTLSGIQQSQNPQLQNATNEINTTLSDAQKDINKSVKDKMTSTTNTLNNALGSKPDSGLKYGLNTPSAAINFPSTGGVPAGRGGSSSTNGGVGNALDGLAKSRGNNQGKPSTGDQNKTFGRNDFWIVKLKDQNKPKTEKVTIEAFPNPALTFTNVIVGYDFEYGTASVYDLAGRQLQSFAIKTRTVPIDLSPYPEGIYIVNIETNVQKDGMKVIKGMNKN